MTTSNYNREYDESTTPGKNLKNIIIAVLAVGVVGTWGYALVHNNKTETVQTQNQAKIVQVTDDKAAVQKSFDESLVRLDSLTGYSNVLKTKIAASNSEISRRKAAIRALLNKKNATAADLEKAKQMIAELNDKIGNMEQQVATLSHDKETLTQDKVALIQDTTTLSADLTTTTVAKEGLEKKVDIASTLNATNIAITPIDVRHNGKEKITTTAKRIDKLVISFDVDNRIAQSGKTDMFVCIKGPDGKDVVADAAGSGTFTTREEGDKSFTAKVPVELDSAKTKKVEFAFKPTAAFQQGTYTIEIYQNGFKVGEGVRQLKKGGLFS
jgi:Tfp pilus assembly protein PilO